MKRKKSIIKAYRRKWRRMPRENRVFVIKFLGTVFLILIIIISLLFWLISHIMKSGEVYKEVSSFSGNRAISVAKLLSEGTSIMKDSKNDEEDSEEAEDVADNEDNGEIELLARLIYAEAGDASWETKAAVASVILNRVQSDTYPNSISEVIYQTGQYPSTAGAAFNGALNDESWECARYVYQNGSQIPANVLYQSKEVQGSGVWAQLDGEYFCYE